MAPKLKSRTVPQKSSPSPKLRASTIKHPSVAPEAEAQVFSLFRKADTNGDGIISSTDLTNILNSIGCGLSETSAAHMFRSADANRDGNVDYQEFLHWVFSKQAPAELGQSIDRVKNELTHNNRSFLYTHRPMSVLNASRVFFQQQETAGRDRAYGAVGSPDYVIECRDFSKGGERRALLSVWDVVNSFQAPSSLRILDLGTGDGHLLYALHKRFNIPWRNLCGVSAEDMRGLGFPVVDGIPPIDLREHVEAKNSYTVWNIEDLHHCTALHGRTFDLIVSWVTFCWLTDPLSAIELIHDRFLERNGIFICGSLQLPVLDVEVIEDQRYLAAVRDRLRLEGHIIDVLGDPTSTFYSWWLQRKTKELLHLWPIIEHVEIPEGTNKVQYAVQLEPGPELEPFDHNVNLTTLQVETKLGLCSEASQFAEALFRMIDVDDSGAIDIHKLPALDSQLLAMAPPDLRESIEFPIAFSDWMSLLSEIIAEAGWKQVQVVCRHSLTGIAKAKAERDAEEEYALAAQAMFTDRIQAGPLWMTKCSANCLENHPEKELIISVWEAVMVLLGRDRDDFLRDRGNFSKMVQKPMANYRQFRDELQDLGNFIGSGESFARWHSLADLQITLSDVDALMSSQSEAFAVGAFKNVQGLSVGQATQCLQVWARKVVKEMRTRASSFVITVAASGAGVATCTNLAGDEIIQRLPLATLTLGDVREATSAAFPGQRVQLISTGGQVLDGVDSILVADAL